MKCQLNHITFAEISNLDFDDDFLDFFGGVDAELGHMGVVGEEEGEG